MYNGEQQYLESLEVILLEGELLPNRTGISAYRYPHLLIKHDMSLGFPLLTTRKMPWKSIRVELEGFIKGITNKRWFQENDCHFWDEWCNPKKIPDNLSQEDRKKFQLEESDLGNIYGATWRNFNSQGYDQLKVIVDSLKKNPSDRRMLCTAWNPLILDEIALPSCHFAWHLTVTNKLNLMWFQRSGDFGLGIPANLASYALLLHLLCKESGLEPGFVTGSISDCHIYENHVKTVKEQLKRKRLPFPSIETENFNSIFDWSHRQTRLENYQHQGKLEMSVAI